MFAASVELAEGFRAGHPRVVAQLPMAFGGDALPDGSGFLLSALEARDPVPLDLRILTGWTASLLDRDY